MDRGQPLLQLRVLDRACGSDTVFKGHPVGPARGPELKLIVTTIMSPPLSRLESADPPPRRKSCLACVKAKRRCDQRSPACIRCSQRRTPCEYPSRPARNQPGPEPTSLSVSGSRHASAADEVAGQDTSEKDASVAESTNTFLFGGPWDSDETRCQPPDDNPFESVGNHTQLMDLLPWTAPVDDMNIFDIGLGSAEFFPSLPLTMPSASPDVAVMSTPQSALPKNFNAEASSKTLEHKLAYAVEKIKYAPKQMLLEVQTPWCHPFLYKDEMPRVMQGQSHIMD